MITQPRMPCYKLGIRFESDGMVKRFLASAKTGFYLSVAREGHVGAGDAIECVTRHEASVRVSDIVRLYVARRYGPAEAAMVRRALSVAALPESWKEHLRGRLSRDTADGE